MADRAVRFDFIGRDVSASKTAGQVESRFGSLGSRLKAFGTFAARSLAVVGAGLGGLAAAGLTMGIKTAAGLEQAEVAFTTLLGSGTKAKAFLEDLKAFAAKTPFELPGLIDNARLLLGVGVAATDVIPTLQAFGDAAGALGINQERFNNIMLATSQAISAGKFQTEDLNQIVENGIPIWLLLAKATGKTVPELRELASEGKLLTKDVLPLLQQQMAKDYGGSMIKQSQTLAGLWSTFMDTINLGLASAIKPFEAELKGALTKAIELAATAFEKLPAVLAKVGDGVHDLWSRFQSLRNSFKEWGFAGLVSSLRSQLVTEFGPGVGKAFDQALDIGKTLYDKARSWADDLINGLDAGIRGGDWTLLAHVIGEKLGEFVTRLPQTIVSLAGKVNWLQLGKNVAKIAVPFALGFLSGIVDGLIDSFMKHPWETTWSVIMIIPFGRFGGAIASILSKIPFLKHFAPLFKGFESLTKPINTAIDKILGLFATGFGEGRLGQLFGKAASAVKGKLDLLVVAVGVKALDFLQAGERLLAGLGKGISDGTAKLPGIIGGVIAKLVSPFAAAGGWLLRHGGEFVSGLLKGIAASSVATTIGGLIARATSPFTTAGGWLLKRGGEFVAGLLKGVSGTSVASTISGLIGRLTSPFAAAGKWLYNAGRAVIEGLISGLWSKFNDLWNTLQHFASTVRNFWPFSPAKVGPLAGQGSLVNAGRNLAAQLAQGMGQGSRLVESAAGHMAAAVSVGAAPVAGAFGVPALAAGGGTIHVGQIVVQGTTDPEQTALRVREALLRLQRRNGTTGLL